MSKWCGKIGLAICAEEDPENNPGVWTDIIKEVPAKGEIIKTSYRYQSNTDSTNDDISLNMSLSIISNTYLTNNFQSIKYITYKNGVWSVTGVSLENRRLILSIGGIYNGERPQRPSQDISEDIGE